MEKKWKRFLLPACVFLCLVLWVTGFLDRATVWEPKLEYEGGDASFSLAAGDIYGRVSGGPYCDLAPGKYLLRWETEGDGENRIRLTDSNGARIEPDEIVIPIGTVRGETEIRILDSAHSFSIAAEFMTGSSFAIRRIRLNSPVWRDNTLTVCILLCLVCMLLLAHNGKKWKSETGGEFIVLALAVLIVSAPCFHRNSVVGYDVQFHAARIMNLADALSAGQIPVRIGGFSYNGYGAATSVFYPDFFLLPWAIAVLVGASMPWVLNSLTLVTNAAAVLSMYATGKRLFNDSLCAVCTSVLYTFSLYRLRDAYTGFMLGEMLAMAFFPLMILGFWELFFEENPRWGVSAVAAVLMIQTHILTAALSACLGLFLLLARLPEMAGNPVRRRAVLLAVLAIAALSLWRIVPMVDLWLSGVNSRNVQFGFVSSAREFRDVLSGRGYVGFALLFGAAAALLSLYRETDMDRKRLIVLCLAGGAAAAWMGTKAFPWSAVSGLTHGAVEVLQFPWRLFLFPAALLSLAGGWGFSIISGGHRAAALCVLMVAAFGAAPYLNDISEGKYEYDIGGQSSRYIIREGHGANPYMIFPEYQIAGTNVQDTRSREPAVSGDVELTAYLKQGTRVDAEIRAKRGGSVSFPLFGFKGYEVRLGETRIPYGLGENNRMKVEIPAGTDAALTVCWRTPALWRICDIISLLSACALLLWWIRKRNGEKIPSGTKVRRAA